MGWFSFLGKSKEPIEAVGSVIDNLFTSDEERLDKEIIKQRLAMQPSMAQAEINKVSASHRSVFVAGARPTLMYVCAVGLAMAFIVNPIIVAFFDNVKEIPVPIDQMMELVLALLGLAGMRTIEKIKGVAK